jgi:hypothetical protein
MLKTVIRRPALLFASIWLAAPLLGLISVGCQAQQDHDQTASDGAAPDRADAAAIDTQAADTTPLDTGVDCMPAKHPGTVTLVNEATGEVKIETVTPENEAMWWRETFDGRVPIVKSVYRKPDVGPAEIFLYGPCGQLVEVIRGAP